MSTSQKPVFDSKQMIEILGDVPLLIAMDIPKEIIQDIGELASLHIGLTSNNYRESDDIMFDIKEEFGEGWDIIDWNILKHDMNYQELYYILEYLGLKVGQTCLVKCNGKRYWNDSNQHYFIGRHNRTNKEGYVQRNLQIHDWIANHMLDLASWHTFHLRIMVIRK